MINRTHVETLLKVNGASPDSKDEVIRSVLLNARYSKDEVDTAIMVLRENIRTSQTRVDGLHKVFRTSDALTPKEISDLLGIQVSISHLQQQEQQSQAYAGVPSFAVWLASVMVATGGILIFMYFYRVGIFHPSVGASLLYG